MSKFKHLLAVAALLFAGVYTANAQVMIETDLTSQFNSLATTKWSGSSGQVGWAAPQVTTNSGLKVAAWERYDGNCSATGVIMSSKVTGLTAGTYKIELYGAAAFTFGRGFSSTAFTNDSGDTNSEFNENDKIDTETGVVLYAKTSEGTYEQEIPIWYATNFNTSGISTAVLDGVEVGENGEIEIGMSKTSTSTNWHVVQLKGVTATVDAAATFAIFKAEAEALYDSPMNADVLSNLRSAANVDLTEADADAYSTAISTLSSKITAAKESVANYAVAKEILDAANGYDATGKASYAADETISAMQTAYNDGTLEAVTAEQKTAAAAALATACKAQDQPADGCNMTPYIVNASFENDFTGWTNSGMQAQGNDSFEKTGTKYAEAWQPNGTKSVSQTITLPNGLYKLSAQCKARGVTSAKLFAGDVETPITVADATDTYSVEVVSIGNEITIGYEGVGTGAGNSWLCVDNFQLTYVRQLTNDEMLPIAIEEYGEVLAAAKAVDLEVKMNAALKAQFVSDLDTYAEDKVLAEPTFESVQQATAVLDKMTKTVTQSIAVYAATGKELAKAEGLDESGKAAFNANADVKAIQTAYNEGTMEEDQSSVIIPAFREAVKAQTTPGADMTAAIINPSFEEADGKGWTIAAGNKNLHGGKADNYCAESYRSTFTLSQVVEGMPNGTYKLTAQGFYRQDGSDNDNLPVFYANDETATFPLRTGSENSMNAASDAFTAGTYTIEPIEFTVEDGTITLGAKLENNTMLWCIWDNFKLTFVEPAPVPFPEDGAKGYLCNVTSKLLVTANGELVGKATADKDRDLFTVWYKTGSNPDKQDGSVVRLAAGQTDGVWNSLRFNKEGKLVCETQDYCKWLLAKDGSYYTLYHNYSNGDTGNVGKGFLTVDPETYTFTLVAEATEYSLWQFVTWEEYDELTTAISSVSNKAAQKAIFNVAGQQIKALQKGLNIVDGKKVYVK